MSHFHQVRMFILINDCCSLTKLFKNFVLLMEIIFLQLLLHRDTNKLILEEKLECSLQKDISKTKNTYFYYQHFLCLLTAKHPLLQLKAYVYLIFSQAKRPNNKNNKKEQNQKKCELKCTEMQKAYYLLMFLTIVILQSHKSFQSLLLYLSFWSLSAMENGHRDHCWQRSSNVVFKQSRLVQLNKKRYFYSHLPPPIESFLSVLGQLSRHSLINEALDSQITGKKKTKNKKLVRSIANQRPKPHKKSSGILFLV